MHADDSAAFMQRLNVLGELFGKELSPAAKALYFDTLRDLSFEDVDRAVNLAARTCTFFPKPAELRALVSGDPEFETERAWLAFRDLAHKIGGYASVTIEDAALAAAIIAIFGQWEQACWIELSPEMWASKRKEFGRVYLVMQAQQIEGPKTLDGYCARQNRLRYGVADPLHQLPAGAQRLLGPKPDGEIERVELEREALREKWRDNVQRAITAKAESV